MRYPSSLIILFIWVFPIHAMELRWNPDGIEKLVYKAAVEADITDELGELDPERWISEPAEFDKIITRLKQLPLKDEYMHYRTHLESLDNGRAIRVRMTGVPVAFKGEAEDEHEAELRERIAAFTGAIMVQGDMDLSGDSADLTFYRVPRERCTLTQFFHLPKNDVAVGDQWRLPVNFIELGPGIFVEGSTTHNRVTLYAVRPSPAGIVAEVRYLLIEKIDGYMKRLTDSERGRLPFSVKTSLFGYGEFLVEKGHWLRQVTIANYAGSGQAKLHKQTLFALELDKGEVD